jgi:hypothetical protein
VLRRNHDCLRYEEARAVAGTPDVQGLASKTTTPAAGSVSRPAGKVRWLHGPVRTHLAVLIAYGIVGGIFAFPRGTYLLRHTVPNTRDAGSYTWGFWWMLHCVEHLSNPWHTYNITAPVGVQLGYHALMPLEGVLLAPVTAIFGPAASYNLLCAVMPGFLCYAMYRLARLWLPTQFGAIVAGAFFGLSSMMVWRSWYHLNIAVGILFIPLALECAVRLRRRPTWGMAVIFGAVLAAALLSDQESDILVILACALCLLPWLLFGTGGAGRAAAERASDAAAERADRIREYLRGLLTRAWPIALAVVVFVVLASPQIIAMLQQAKSGGTNVPAGATAVDYVNSGVPFPDMFALSPRVYQLGMHGLSFMTYHGGFGDGIADYGLAVTGLAILGVVVCWRRRPNSRLLLLLWAGCTVLCLGSAFKIGDKIFTPFPTTYGGVKMSLLMPFTWFVHVPGLQGFREAGRITMLGIVPAALLAGAGVEWLRQHYVKVLIPVMIVALIEAGWSGNYDVGKSNYIGRMPTALNKLDNPIAADHSQSIVVDVPFGIRSGLLLPGEGLPFNAMAQMLQTHDGHPRAVAFLSRLPLNTLAAIQNEPFYGDLMRAECLPANQAKQVQCRDLPSASAAAARQNARSMDVGYVLLWPGTPKQVVPYLKSMGFVFDYKADGVRVWRPASKQLSGVTAGAATPGAATPSGG